VVYRKKGGGDASAWPGVFSKLAETSLQ